MTPTALETMVDPAAFLKKAVAAKTIDSVQMLIDELNIASEAEYTFDEKAPEKGWQPGKLHWYAVGGQLGNAGRIQLADKPEFPIAERTVNAQEAMIELMRRRELKANPTAPAPKSPREAVTRYFDLPPLDELPFCKSQIHGMAPVKYAREIARKVRVRAQPVKAPEKIAGKKEASREWCVTIEDEGIGQPPSTMHSTLLSMGSSDKADKPYLIGLFGQGGSSAYRASQFSWIVSRRPADLLDGADDGISWTIIKRVQPAGIRRVYWAYLAAHPDGRVPFFPATLAGSVGMTNGTWISHVGYDFGKFDIVLGLYRALNHLLFNPVLPYELYTGANATADPMSGNAYLLARQKAIKGEKVVYRTFVDQPVEQK